MTGLRSTIFLAGCLALAPLSAALSEPIRQLISVQQLKASSTDDPAEEPNILIKEQPIIKVPPQKPQQQRTQGSGQPTVGTAGPAVAEKKKGGKKGTKGQQQEFMTIKMDNVMVTGRTAPTQPKGPPSGGLLSGSPGGFNQSGPSATGTMVAPPPPPRPNIIN